MHNCGTNRVWYRTILALFMLGFNFTLFSQGKITGKIFDGDANDVLPFANINVKNTNLGTTSDFDGNYEIEISEPGTYTLTFSFLGFATKEIENIEIKTNNVVDLNVTLRGSTAKLEDVIITTTLRKNTEQAVLTLQKNAVKLLDGLSIETIKATGASNTASAVKNIPGVSVQGGKFVYVRGLGDRYTKSILNGMDVPGLDPDRNTLQLDIFPTNILENVLVSKSSTADQPADFTGGVVDIVTKDFPARKEYSLSLGLGYNSNMHFKDNYLNYTSSSTDFLGFDNGDRDNPLSNTSGVLPLPQQQGELIREYTQRLNPELAAQRATSGGDFSLGFTLGNQHYIGEENKLGYLASISYKNETTFYDSYINGQIFRKSDDTSKNELEVDRTNQGELGNNNVLISALAGVSYKTAKSKYKLNLLHIQNGESEASLYDQINREGNSNEIKQDNLIYTQRSITNLLLHGKHVNEDASWNIDWKLSPTYTKVQDKDFRSTNFRVLTNDDGSTELIISPSEAGDPRRFWRDLEEINLSGKLDFSKKHFLFGKDAKLQFGGASTLKERDFGIDQFSTPFAGVFDTATLNGDPNQILAPENIFNTTTNNGFFVRRDSNISDTFNSIISVNAAYISEEFQITSRLKSILGVRFEKFDLIYTGQNQQNQIFDKDNILDKADFFPSLNLIYNLNEDANQKVRGSFSRTTARPSFKEASLAEIFDPASNTFSLGNIDIQPTYINNIDLRYENYGEGSNFFAFSAFYKTFDDPIELSFIRAASGQFTPLNLADAVVYGLEVEFRRKLDFIPAFQNLSFTSNFSLIESNQSFSVDERNAREDNLRDGESLPDGRTLQGQSPYLINTGINYNNQKSGWKGGIFYNVQGKTLQIVGNGDIPDIFTLPFHNLNLNLSKSLGEDQKSSITLKFSNILNDDRESVFESYRAENQLFSKWSPGQDISLSYSYKF